VTRNSDDSGVGKALFGGAVGFALYFLITGLGFGFGGGRGGGRGVGEGEPPAPPPSPPRPKDEARLSFLMTEPSAPGHPTGFQLRAGGKLDPKLYAVEELIARVKEGGRSDVELRASGAVIQGPWDAARAAVKRAGLTVWGDDPSSTHAPPHVAGVGNTRGHYGRSL
jgi:hypothetical protein